MLSTSVVADASAFTVRTVTPEEGLTVSLAIGLASAPTVAVALEVRPAASVAVTVTVYVPTGVLAPAVSVSVELLPAVSEEGLKEAVAPAGKPLAAKLTV